MIHPLHFYVLLIKYVIYERSFCLHSGCVNRIFVGGSTNDIKPTCKDRRRLKKGPAQCIRALPIYIVDHSMESVRSGHAQCQTDDRLIMDKDGKFRDADFPDSRVGCI